MVLPEGCLAGEVPRAMTRNAESQRAQAVVCVRVFYASYAGECSVPAFSRLGHRSASALLCHARFVFAEFWPPCSPYMAHPSCSPSQVAHPLVPATLATCRDLWQGGEVEAISAQQMRDIAAGTRDKGTIAVLYAPWCQFCQVGPDACS